MIISYIVCLVAGLYFFPEIGYDRGTLLFYLLLNIVFAFLLRIVWLILSSIIIHIIERNDE